MAPVISFANSTLWYPLELSTIDSYLSQFYHENAHIISFQCEGKYWNIHPVRNLWFHRTTELFFQYPFKLCHFTNRTTTRQRSRILFKCCPHTVTDKGHVTVNTGEGEYNVMYRNSSQPCLQQQSYRNKITQKKCVLSEEGP